MTNTTAALRYFGRCTVKGCTHRRVIDDTTPNTKRFTTGRSDVLTVLDADGRDWPLYALGDRDHNAVMRVAGFACPTHNTVIDFRGGRFTYNPDKVCDGRCMGATGPACDCSCSGANHGSARI
ncbi:hypothetical protein [Amycolatopsis magusensis]|uniref:hypothetical protein n=1 Tax=Amycolatopsis magusensis TaxID=882444 RepID=UPI00378843EE